MIPNSGCDPRVNVVRLGAELLQFLHSGPQTIAELLKRSSEKLGVSVDHVILTLDWLYAISAIECVNDEIFIK